MWGTEAGQEKVWEGQYWGKAMSVSASSPWPGEGGPGAGQQTQAVFLRKEMRERILSVLHSLGKRHLLVLHLGSVSLCRVFLCGCSGWQWVSTQLSKHRGDNVCLFCLIGDIKHACSECVLPMNWLGLFKAEN